MMSDSQGMKRGVTMLGGFVLLALVLSSAGCAQTGMSSRAVDAKMSAQKATGSSGMDMASADDSGTSDPDAQECADCAGEGMAPMVDGTVETKDGVQVIAVGVKDGYYSPNQFTAKTGTPINVVFTGNTKGCLGKPTFKSLGKKANFNDSGTATIELGSLPPGTYEFACGMNMVGGKIVVE